MVIVFSLTLMPGVQFMGILQKLLPEAYAAVAPFTATLNNIIDTSAFVPPSPDPSGIDYIAGEDLFIITDAEVNEMSIFVGENLFKTDPSGSLVATASTLVYSDEPTGIAYNPNNGHVFITDDVKRRIFDIGPGTDRKYEARDGVYSSLRAKKFGADDLEGVAYDPVGNTLFVCDGVDAEVYVIPLGPDGTLKNVPVDQITSFDTEALGVIDPEGIGYNPATDHLYIAGNPTTKVKEVTKDGVLYREIDISAAKSAGMKNSSGLGFGPSSSNPEITAMYITDRGRDNKNYPDENDGKVFELSLPAENQAPIVTITSPIDGNSYPAEATISLAGTVIDDYDTDLTIASWQIDGVEIPGSSTSAVELDLGAHTITATSIPDGEGLIGTAGVTFTVVPNTIPLTITANDTGKTYGDELTFAGTEFTAIGLEAGDSCTVTLTSTGAAASANVDNYDIVPSNAAGLPEGKYNVSYQPGTLTVDPADANVTVTGYTGVYDGAAHGATGSAIGIDGLEVSGLDLGASFTEVPGGTAYWTFTNPNYLSESGDVAIIINPVEATIMRFSGDNRVGTAGSIAEYLFPDGADTVIIGESRKMADSMIGTLLAGALNAPILLADSQTDLADYSILKGQISSLSPTNIYLLGSSTAVSDELYAYLQNEGYTVTRVAGADRFATAMEIIKEAKNHVTLGSTLYIANGRGETDANGLMLAAEGYALAPSADVAGNYNPVLLIDKNWTSAEKAARVNSLIDTAGLDSITNCIILGDTTQVPTAVEDVLYAKLSGATITRESGDVFTVSANLAVAYASANAASDVTIARGDILADALAGGLLAGQSNAPLIFVNTDSIPTASYDAINTIVKAGSKAYILGSTFAVSDYVAGIIEQLISAK